MSAFLPRHCPFPSCSASVPELGFRFRRDGTFRRLCDGRRVQRFFCHHCRRRFSSQSFRLDRRQQKPWINVALFSCLVSKVSHRQSARTLRVDRKTVTRRLLLWGPAMNRFHEVMLDRARKRGGLTGTFSLDELETYETDRRLQPITVPILIHRDSRFIVHLESAPLPARGGLSRLDRARKEARERRFGRRKSGSSRAVEACLVRLKSVHSKAAPLEMVTDRKAAYPPLVRRHFAPGGAHVRVSSSETRNTLNPLFPINHSLAMLRDHVSRLVRRSWCASKSRERLDHHLWIYAAWRNYVRPMFNRTPRDSAACVLGLAKRRFAPAQLLRWIWPDRQLSASS